MHANYWEKNRKLNLYHTQFFYVLSVVMNKYYAENFKYMLYLAFNNRKEHKYIIFFSLNKTFFAQ